MLEIFDPPMCCSTGICGPEVDPDLVEFANDLNWLKRQGVDVQRYNMSQTPEAFVDNPAVCEVVAEHGTEVLPLIVLDGKVVSKSRYPSRAELAEIAGTANTDAPVNGVNDSIFTPQVAELVALGAAIASNCEPCFRFHYDKARKLGVSREDMVNAVNTAQAVKDAPARAMLDLAGKYLVPESSASCCDGSNSNCC